MAGKNFSVEQFRQEIASHMLNVSGDDGTTAFSNDPEKRIIVTNSDIEIAKLILSDMKYHIWKHNQQITRMPESPESDISDQSERVEVPAEHPGYEADVEDVAPRDDVPQSIQGGSTRKSLYIEMAMYVDTVLEDFEKTSVEAEIKQVLCRSLAQALKFPVQKFFISGLSDYPIA